MFKAYAKQLPVGFPGLEYIFYIMLIPGLKEIMRLLLPLKSLCILPFMTAGEFLP